MSQIDPNLWVTFPGAEGDSPVYVRIAAIDAIREQPDGQEPSTRLHIKGGVVWVAATAAEVLTKLTDAVVIASGL